MNTESLKQNVKAAFTKFPAAIATYITIIGMIVLLLKK